MEKRTSEYWQERFQQLEEAQHDTSVQTMQSIEQEFRRTEQVLDGKINAWYQRFASNNKISMIEARKLLNSDELEEFKWDVQDYIKYGEENGINQQWMKELENASAKVHISRLEALKLQTQQEFEKLYGNYHDSIDEHITNLYTSGYYHTAFEVQRGMGVGWQMQNFNSEKVSDIIHKPWAVDGRNFSDRVWTDKTRLINSMHDSLTRMCITGESPDRAIQEISKNMKVSRSQAARIVQTESAAFSAKAQESCFSDLGVEEFQVVETLDSNTCDTCGEMDGKHFQMKDYKIGVTVPPFHPNCRGCTCPYFDDEFTVGERVAHGEDGETYYVPADMTYEEWKSASIDGNMKAVSAPKIRNPKIRNAYDSFNEMLADSEENSMLTNNMIMYGESTEYIEDITCKSPFAYDTERDAIIYNPQTPYYELYDLSYVQAHELSHRMDIKEYHSWNNIAFQNAIEVSTQKVYDNIETLRGWFAEGGKFENDMAFSDIISALTEGKENDFLYSGHSIAYWQNEKSKCLEIFANMCSIEINGYDSKEALQSMFDELYKAFQEMIN